MKIRLDVTGGFAGLIEHWPVIELDKLPSHVKNHLLELIEDSDFFNMPERLEETKGYDFIYTTLTINDHEVTDIDPSSDPTQDQANFRVLVDHVKGVYELLGLKPRRKT